MYAPLVACQHWSPITVSFPFCSLVGWIMKSQYMIIPFLATEIWKYTHPNHSQSLKPPYPETDLQGTFCTNQTLELRKGVGFDGLKVVVAGKKASKHN